MQVNNPPSGVVPSASGPNVGNPHRKISVWGETSAAAPAATQHAHFLIAAMEGGPTETQNRDEFAQVTFSQINGLKDVQIQDAEPLRIGGQTGYETLATAKDGKTDSDVRVVQWLRFGSGSYMQMIGVSPADRWPDVFRRLRAVRDSVNPK